MKSSITKATALLLLLVLAMFSSEASFNDMKDASLIEKICTQPKVLPFRQFCIDTLKYHFDPITSDLYDFGDRAIIATIKEGQSALVTLEIKTKDPSSDPTMRSYLQKCSNLYDEIINVMQKGEDDLLDGSFQVVKDKATSSALNAQRCATTFNGPPARASPITSNIDKTNKLCTIVSVIADLLAHRVLVISRN